MFLMKSSTSGAEASSAAGVCGTAEAMPFVQSVFHSLQGPALYRISRLRLRASSILVFHHYRRHRQAIRVSKRKRNRSHSKFLGQESGPPAQFKNGPPSRLTVDLELSST